MVNSLTIGNAWVKFYFVLCTEEAYLQKEISVDQLFCKLIQILYLVFVKKVDLYTVSVGDEETLILCCS